jgi:RNA polymerase sigma factor (sigma-70 family)
MEERVCITRWQRDRDKWAITELVKGNYGSIIYCIKRWKRGSRIPWDDLFQEGVLALIRAADRFDLSTDNRFSTLLFPYLDGWMGRAIARERWHHMTGHGTHHLSKNLPEPAVTIVMDRPTNMKRRTEAYYMERGFEDIEFADLWEGLLSLCDDREQFIMVHYYREGRTYNEIGMALGISRERVRQLLKTLWGRFRLYLEEEPWDYHLDPVFGRVETSTEDRQHYRHWRKAAVKVDPDAVMATARMWDALERGVVV